AEPREQCESAGQCAPWGEQTGRQARISRRHDEPESAARSHVVEPCSLFTLCMHDRGRSLSQLTPDDVGDCPRAEHPQRGTSTALVVRQCGPPQSIWQRPRRVDELPWRFGEDHGHVMATTGERRSQGVGRALPIAAVPDNPASTYESPKPSNPPRAGCGSMTKRSAWWKYAPSCSVGTFPVNTTRCERPS